MMGQFYEWVSVYKSETNSIIGAVVTNMSTGFPVIFHQDKFVHQVTKMIEKKNEDSQEVKTGWFTPHQMKTELKWESSLFFIHLFDATCGFDSAYI